MSQQVVGAGIYPAVAQGILPTWTATVSITGKIATLVSGSITPAYPGMAVRVSAPFTDLDRLLIKSWPVDSSHLQFDWDTLASGVIATITPEATISATHGPLGPGQTVTLGGRAFVQDSGVWIPSPSIDDTVSWDTASAVDGHTATFTAPGSISRVSNLLIGDVSNGFASATVSVTGAAVTWVSGALFVNIPNGQINLVGYGTFFVSVASPTSLTINGNISGTHTVTAKWGPWKFNTLVTLVPLVVCVESDFIGDICATETVQLTARVFGADNTAVTWSCTGPGTIDSSGLYTAPGVADCPVIDVVSATSVADGATKGTWGFRVRPFIGQHVKFDPATYTPPSGWKFTGDPGTLISRIPTVVRRLIIPA